MAYVFNGTYKDAGEDAWYRAKVLNFHAKTREALLEAARDSVEDAIKQECLKEMHAFTFNQAYCWIEDGKRKTCAFALHLSKQDGEMIVDVIFIPTSSWKDALLTAKRINMLDHDAPVTAEWVDPELN